MSLRVKAVASEVSVLVSDLLYHDSYIHPPSTPSQAKYFSHKCCIYDSFYRVLLAYSSHNGFK